MLYAQTIHPVMSSRMDEGSREQLQRLPRQSFWVCCLYGQRQESRKEFLSHRDHTNLPSVPLSSFFKMKVMLLFSFLFRLLLFEAKDIAHSLHLLFVQYVKADLLCLLVCVYEWHSRRPQTIQLPIQRTRFSIVPLPCWSPQLTKLTKNQRGRRA